MSCLWGGSSASLRMSSVSKFTAALKRWVIKLVKLVLIIPETGLTDNPGASIECWGFAGRFPAGRFTVVVKTVPFWPLIKKRHHQREVEDTEIDCNRAELTCQGGSKSHNTKSHIQKHLPVHKRGEKSELELLLCCRDEDLYRCLKPQTEKGDVGVRTRELR